MRRSDEQLREVLKRSASLKQKHMAAKKTGILSAFISLCAVLICLTAAYLPSVAAVGENITEKHYGSLILSAGHMGYVIIALLAFILGILVTMLCFHLNELKKGKETEK